MERSTVEQAQASVDPAPIQVDAADPGPTVTERVDEQIPPVEPLPDAPPEPLVETPLEEPLVTAPEEPEIQQQSATAPEIAAETRPQQLIARMAERSAPIEESQTPMPPAPAQVTETSEASEISQGDSVSSSAQAQSELESHIAAIRRALSAFAAAYGSRSAAQLRNAWPTIGRKQLNAIEQSFTQAKSITMTLNGCDINVTGNRAEARCQLRQEYVSTQGPSQSINRPVVLGLTYTDRWTVTGMS